MARSNTELGIHRNPPVKERSLVKTWAPDSGVLDAGTDDGHNENCKLCKEKQKYSIQLNKWCMCFFWVPKFGNWGSKA